MEWKQFKTTKRPNRDSMDETKGHQTFYVTVPYVPLRYYTNQEAPCRTSISPYLGTSWGSKSNSNVATAIIIRTSISWCVFTEETVSNNPWLVINIKGQWTGIVKYQWIETWEEDGKHLRLKMVLRKFDGFLWVTSVSMTQIAHGSTHFL